MNLNTFGQITNCFETFKSLWSSLDHDVDLGTQNSKASLHPLIFRIGFSSSYSFIQYTSVLEHHKSLFTIVIKKERQKFGNVLYDLEMV